MNLRDIRENVKILREVAKTLFGSKKQQPMGAGGFGLLTGSLPPRRGSWELLQAYNDMPWLRAAVNKIAIAIGSTTWQVFAIRKQGKPVKMTKIQKAGAETRASLLKAVDQVGDLEELDDHPLLDLLYSKGQATISHLQLNQIYLDLLGEAFWLIERNKLGVPVMLWPIPPTWVYAIPTADEPFFKVNIGATQENIPITEMLWLAEPNPANPYSRGTGLAGSLGDELEIDEFTAKHVKSYFYNKARPDLIISADGLTKEDTERLEQRWLEKTEGFWKSFKPFFLNKEVKVEQLNQTFESMQLTDLRKFERDTIIQVFGVPPEILGIIENSNRATIDASDYIFSRWVVQPRMERLRSFFQERLVSEFDERIILDYVSPIPEDREFNLRAAQAAPYALRVNEWRALMGLPELAEGEGEVFIMPFNLLPTRHLISPQPTSSSPPASSPPEEGLPTTPEEALPEKVYKDFTEDDLEELLELIDAESIKKNTKKVYRDIVEAFGSDLLSIITPGIDFDLQRPEVLQFLEKGAFVHVKDINETTINALRETFKEGMRLGENREKLAKRVNTVFTEAKTTRAMTIARTESLRASQFGSHEAMHQGGAEGKEWVATMDDRVRDSHAMLDGVIVGINEEFQSPMTGATAAFPGDFGVPEEDINCRCAIAPVLSMEKMTPEARAVYWKKFDMTLATWERRMRTAYIKAFQEQQNEILRRLRA